MATRRCYRCCQARVGAIAQSKKVEQGGKEVTFVVLKAETIDKYGLKPRE